MRSLRRPSPPNTPRRSPYGAGILACAGSALLAGLALGLGPSRPAAAHATTPAPAASAHTTTITTASAHTATTMPATVHSWRAYIVAAPQTIPGGPGLTSASGWLIVPRVIEPGTAGTGTSIWLGLEGTGRRLGLVQAGVWAYPGRPDRAWVATCGTCAMTPAPKGDAVKAGDHLYISVTWLGGDHWSATIRDVTAEWAWTDSVSFPAETDAQALFADEWGPVRFAGGGRIWWPTTTWRGSTAGARGHGTLLAGGCLPIRNLPPFIFRNCPPTH